MENRAESYTQENEDIMSEVSTDTAPRFAGHPPPSPGLKFTFDDNGYS